MENSSSAQEIVKEEITVNLRYLKTGYKDGIPHRLESAKTLVSTEDHMQATFPFHKQSNS